jgi:RNA polymerase sigma-70 factor (ECF subfamily)
MDDSELDTRFERYRTAGDLTALGEVFDALAPQLVAIARHLGPPPEAEDLVQATFLTALEKAQEFDVERAVAPWLIGILAGHAANARRRRARRAEAALDEFEDGIASRARTPAQAAEAGELHEALASALDGLPPTYRDVLRALLCDGSKPGEIAKRLGITPNAARVRVHRGLQKLRAALPAGLAAGAAAALVGGRGLAEVRRVVLEEGAARAAALGVSASASGGLTAWIAKALVAQRAVAAAVLVAVVSLSVVLWRAQPDADSLEVANSRVETGFAPSPETVAPARADAPAPVAPLESTRLAAAATDVRFVGRAAHMLNGSSLEGARVWTRDEATGERVLRAVSDAKGAFEFRAALGVEQALVVEAEGYAPRRVPLSAERRERFWREACRVEHDGGRTVHLFEIRLWPGLEVHGRVVDRDGRGVEGAELVIVEASGGSLRTVEEHSIGRSGRDGSIELDGRLPIAFVDNGRHWILFAVHASGIGWTRVAAPQGRDALEGIDVVLDDALALEFEVRDLEGAPIAGATVSLVPMHEPFPRLTGMQHDLLPLAPALASAHRAVTDENGFASMRNALGVRSSSGDGLLGSRYVVEVEHEGRVLFREFRTVRNTSPERIELRLPRTPAALALRGFVRNVAGEPIVGASVKLEGDDGAVLDSAASGNDGEFELDVDPGAPLLLAIEASAPACATARAGIDRGIHGALSRPLDLRLGAALSIHGRVVDENGAPLQGIHVFADAPGNGLGGSETSDENGEFEIDELLAGEYVLGAVLDSEGEHEQLDSPRAKTGDRDVRLVLSRRRVGGGRIELELVDERDGAPLDAVAADLIALDAERGFPRPPNLSAGRVTFTEVLPGRYAAWIAVSGRANAHVELEVREGSSVVRERVRIGSVAKFIGHVELPQSMRGTRVMVRAELESGGGARPGADEYSAGGTTTRQVGVDSAGNFEMDGLVPGRWKVSCEGEGVGGGPVRAELASGASSDLTIVARAMAVLELRLDRFPVRGCARLEVVRAGGGEWELRGIWGGSFEQPFTLRANLPPEPLSWRLRFTDECRAGASRDTFAALEGNENAGAGERVVRELVVRDP